MQGIIQEVQSLTQILQAENQHLLARLQQYSTLYSPIKPTEAWSATLVVSPKAAEVTSFSRVSRGSRGSQSLSRVSSSTVKQSSQGDATVKVLKQSRLTAKSSLSRCKVKGGSIKKGKSLFQEASLVRLKKVSVKVQGKIPSCVLLNKKSKIYHFQVPL